MNTNTVKSRTCTYNIAYHMHWNIDKNTTKLSESAQLKLKEIIYDISQEKEFLIRKLEIIDNSMIDIHISAHPKYSISYIVKMLKGISGRKLCIEFPNLKKGKQFWENSFFVETLSNL